MGRICRIRVLLFMLLSLLIAALPVSSVFGETALPLGEDARISLPDATYLELQIDPNSFTKVSLFTETGIQRWSILLPFTARDAVYSEGYLYMVGHSSGTSSELAIARLSLESRRSLSSSFPNIVPSEPLTWEVQQGLLLLEGTQLFSENTDRMLFTFAFSDSAPYLLRTEVLLPALSSSEEPSPSSSGASVSSETPSNVSSDSSSGSSAGTVFSFQPVTDGTTVSWILSSYADTGYFLRILDASGAVRESGTVGTGWTVQFWKGALLEKEVCLIVPGDLGGSVSMNRERYARAILEIEPLEAPYAQAADLNGDGKITVADLVLYRKIHG